MWGLLGVALSPLVVYASAALSEGVGYYGGGGVGGGAGGRGTVDAVSSLITMDFSTYASLMATTALLAPVLEETVFRGFLLTSLTRWVPVPAAVALSSLAFGFVHLTPRDVPQACVHRTAGRGVSVQRGGAGRGWCVGMTSVGCRSAVTSPFPPSNAIGSYRSSACS